MRPKETAKRSAAVGSGGVAVREARHFADTDIGTALMRKTFDKTTGLVSDMEQPEAEHEALAHLFARAIGSYKKPHSHRTVFINDATVVQEMVVLASHFLRIVDSRRQPMTPNLSFEMDVTPVSRLLVRNSNIGGPLPKMPKFAFGPIPAITKR